MYKFKITLKNAETGRAAHMNSDINATSYFKAWQTALNEALWEMSRRGVTWIVESIEDNNGLEEALKELD